MEKHASLVDGLASEIADGKEGDQDIYRKLSEEASAVIDRIQKNKATHQFTEDDINFYRDWSRTWRRKLQGATEGNHNHAEHTEKEHNHKDNERLDNEEALFKRCVGPNCQTEIKKHEIA